MQRPSHRRRPRAGGTDVRELAIYDGRNRIGSITARGADHEAFDVDDRPLGHFPSQREAIAAIAAIAAARTIAEARS